MILVTGSIVARSETFAEILQLSREHVARSRLEAGCISHAVHVDCDHPLRLVFVERWTDMTALTAHFAVPASRTFGKALAGLAAQVPDLQIYDANEVRP